jgi:hypothetical protein
MPPTILPHVSKSPPATFCRITSSDTGLHDQKPHSLRPCRLQQSGMRSASFLRARPRELGFFRLELFALLLSDYYIKHQIAPASSRMEQHHLAASLHTHSTG